MLSILFLISSLGLSTPTLASPCLSSSDLARLSTPLQTSEEALDLIHDLGLQFRSCNDIHGLFAEVYTSTLIAIDLKIKQHYFEDPDFVKKILVAHSDLYRKALYSEQSKQLSRMPESWQTAFKALHQKDFQPGTLLILSMNAHIAYDMVETLIKVKTPFQSDSAKNDYIKVTKILKSSMDDLWIAFRTYDHNNLTLPKGIEEKLVVEWAAWMRNKAWRDAKKCSLETTNLALCLKKVDQEANRRSHYYKNLDFIMH